VPAGTGGTRNWTLGHLGGQLRLEGGDLGASFWKTAALDGGLMD